MNARLFCEGEFVADAVVFELHTNGSWREVNREPLWVEDCQATWFRFATPLAPKLRNQGCSLFFASGEVFSLGEIRVEKHPSGGYTCTAAVRGGG
jgi:hypothetical protein